MLMTNRREMLCRAAGTLIGLAFAESDHEQQLIDQGFALRTQTLLHQSSPVSRLRFS
jgi:hypothetical protein